MRRFLPFGWDRVNWLQTLGDTPDTYAFPPHGAVHQPATGARAKRLDDPERDGLRQHLVVFVQALSPHETGRKLAGIQRPFGPERIQAKRGCFAASEDPVQIDIGGEVIDIVVDLEQPQGGDDVRQIGLGLFQPRLVFGDGVADAVALLAQDGDCERFGHAPLSVNGAGLTIRGLVSLHHNAGKIGWGTRIRT